MKLLVYRANDLGGEPFQVIDNVTFNTPYNITGMASNTEYSVVLLDDFNNAVDLKSQVTSLTTVDMPRGTGYYIRNESSDAYPITLYDSNGDKIVPEYYHIFLDHDGNFEALADPQIHPYSLDPDYIVDTNVDLSFPVIQEPYCVMAIANGQSLAISEVMNL